jgi:hypothetical protein
MPNSGAPKKFSAKKNAMTMSWKPSVLITTSTLLKRRMDISLDSDWRAPLLRNIYSKSSTVMIVPTMP